jgi:hypothetical protein
LEKEKQHTIYRPVEWRWSLKHLVWNVANYLRSAPCYFHIGSPYFVFNVDLHNVLLWTRRRVRWKPQFRQFNHLLQLHKVPHWILKRIQTLQKLSWRTSVPVEHGNCAKKNCWWDFETKIVASWIARGGCCF